MNPCFTSTLTFTPHRIHAVALYCSDGRFGDQIDDFLHHHLGLPNYDRVALPGGPAWLRFRGNGSLGQYALVRDQIDFLVQAHGLHRAVLIAHYGCAYYLRKHGRDADGVLAQQIEDLHDGARTLRIAYPSVEIETYLARADGVRVSFTSSRDH